MDRMRTVAEYLARAAEFDELANTAPHPDLKKRYADMAECYRLLAKERKRLAAEGIIPLDQHPQPLQVAQQKKRDG